MIRPLAIATSATRAALRLSVLLPAVAVSACVSMSERTGQATIDRTFSAAAVGSSAGDAILVFTTARENSGTVEVCVAFMPKTMTGTGGEFFRHYLAGASVTVDGERVIQDLSFANELAWAADASGKPANCARGSVDWKAHYALWPSVIEFSRMKFKI